MNRHPELPAHTETIWIYDEENNDLEVKIKFTYDEYANEYDIKYLNVTEKELKNFTEDYEEQVIDGIDTNIYLDIIKNEQDYYNDYNR